jgi:hypothetical protein
VAAVALGGASAGGTVDGVHHFALGGDLEAKLAAGFGFEVQRLGNGGGTAHLAELQDLDIEVAGVVGDVELVTQADFASGLNALPGGLDAAKLARLGGERARLEEARRPEPFVDSHTHGCILPRNDDGFCAVAQANYRICTMSGAGTPLPPYLQIPRFQVDARIPVQILASKRVIRKI